MKIMESIKAKFFGIVTQFKFVFLTKQIANEVVNHFYLCVCVVYTR